MRQLFFCLLLSFFSLSAYSQNQKLNLQGAWKLVQVQQIENNKTETILPGKYTGEQIKIWSGSQFMFVGRYIVDTKTEDQYGMGTFKLDGSKYEEFLPVFSYKPWESKVIRLKMEMKNDTLIQTFPLNEKFETDENTTNIEKYVRIK
jgi:hypothetical protein